LLTDNAYLLATDVQANGSFIARCDWEGLVSAVNGGSAGCPASFSVAGVQYHHSAGNLTAPPDPSAGATLCKGEVSRVRHTALHAIKSCTDMSAPMRLKQLAHGIISHAVACTSIAGYTFTPDKLSSGVDIGVQQLRKSAAQLAALCSENPACKGFTSSGWLKSTLMHPVFWTNWNATSTLSPCDGMFVRSDYTFAGEWWGHMVLHHEQLGAEQA